MEGWGIVHCEFCNLKLKVYGFVCLLVLMCLFVLICVRVLVALLWLPFMLCCVLLCNLPVACSCVPIVAFCV